MWQGRLAQRTSGVYPPVLQCLGFATRVMLILMDFHRPFFGWLPETEEPYIVCFPASESANPKESLPRRAFQAWPVTLQENLPLLKIPIIGESLFSTFKSQKSKPSKSQIRKFQNVKARQFAQIQNLFTFVILILHVLSSFWLLLFAVYLTFFLCVYFDWFLLICF